jgi:hypothetical protein
MIRVKCPGCSSILDLLERDAGALGQCPACERQFRIPSTAGSAAGRRKVMPAEAVEEVTANPPERPVQAAPAALEMVGDDLPVSDDPRRHGSEPTNYFFLEDERRRRRRRRKQARSERILGLTPFLISVIAILAMAVVLFPLALLSSVMSIVFIVFGVVVSCVGGLWFMCYYRDGSGEPFEPAPWPIRWGLLMLVFHIAYGIQDPKGLGRPVLLEVIGFILCLLGIGLYLAVPHPLDTVVLPK